MIAIVCFRIKEVFLSVFILLISIKFYIGQVYF